MTRKKNHEPRRMPATVIFILVLTAATALAVPGVVEEKFKEKYSDIPEVKWDVDSNGYWEGDFEKDGEKYRADFSETGEWIETERSLKFEQLPDVVRSAISQEHGDRKIAEIEEVDSAAKGMFYDVEFDKKGPNEDHEYNAKGEKLEGLLGQLNSAVPAIHESQSSLEGMTRGGMAMEFGVNLLSILIYACGIYYLRHHNHKMMFLLLAFNIFLFPIFMLSSVLTMGFGFTIFALLALVRLRSENFDKAEVAYLLGAVALTFINSQLDANIEIAASALVLLTAYLADHPRLWRSAYQTTEVRYRTSDTKHMLDRAYLSKVISEEFDIIVNDIEITRVARKEVRLVVVYSDPEGKAYVNKVASRQWKLKKKRAAEKAADSGDSEKKKD